MKDLERISHALMPPSLLPSRCRNAHVLSCIPSHSFPVGFLAISDIPMKGGGEVNPHSGKRLAGWIGRDLHVEVSVHLGVLHFLPNLGTHHIDLLLRVAQHAREERIGEGFETFHDLEIVPGADFLLSVHKWVRISERKIKKVRRKTECGEILID